MAAGDDEVTTLARAAARGDADALAELVRATQGDVWRFISYLAGRDAADDLTQETYLRAVRSLPTFRNRAPFRVWLLAVARRVVAAHFDDKAREELRRNRAWAQPRHPGAGDPAEEVALRGLIADLDHDRRDAFVLTQLLGYSYEEAATACGCPVGTIRSRVARAREQLIGIATGGTADVQTSARRSPR